ncbi:MAG: hypothetical protein AB1546_05440, partial [bacterium]
RFEVQATDPDRDLQQILINIQEIGITVSMLPDSQGIVEGGFSLPDDLVPAGTYHFTVQAKDRTKMYSEIVEKKVELLKAEGNNN